jgi:hypothetical protein
MLHFCETSEANHSGNLFTKLTELNSLLQFQDLFSEFVSIGATELLDLA